MLMDQNLHLLVDILHTISFLYQLSLHVKDRLVPKQWYEIALSPFSFSFGF